MVTKENVRRNFKVGIQMKWQYKISLLLLLISQILFFGLILYHMDPEGNSWILSHQEHWVWVFVIVGIALGMFVFGAISEVVGDLHKGEWTD